MKTESEKEGDAARASATVVVLGPDGKEVRRYDGVAGWMIGVMTIGGETSVDSPLPPDVAAGMLALMQARYVSMPYLAAIQAQVRAQAPRVIPVSATGVPSNLPVPNGRPRIVVP